MKITPTVSPKVLFILMPSKFRDEEFSVPYQILKENGCKIDVAGLQEGMAIGVNGFRFKPDRTINHLDDAELAGYQAVVVPGGPGSRDFLWDNKAVQHILNYFNQHKRIVATICFASVVPVQSGMLRGKVAAGCAHDEIKQIFADNGVELSSERCVSLATDRIITAQGPQDCIPFGNAIVDLLGQQ